MWEDIYKDYQWITDAYIAKLNASELFSNGFEEFKKFFTSYFIFHEVDSIKYSIVIANETSFIGNVMCYNIDYKKLECELGIVIGEKNYHNNGFGTESVLCMLKYVFSQSPIQRVYLHTLCHNVFAQGAFTKCGFNQVYIVKRDGYIFNLMETNKKDWIKKFSFTDSIKVCV